MARASARSKIEDVEKIFKEADANGDGLLSLEELRSYLGDYLGYGQAEIRDFFEEFKAEAGQVDLPGLQTGFPRLNPYLIGKRKGCTVWRQPGAVCAPGAQMNIEDLVDCKVYVCDRTEQTFVDECSGCEVLIGTCEGATFVRDCRQCTFWVATRQLRTRNCVGCNFFLHSHTEPIIESSKDLGFAPFAASYPGLAQHLSQAAMDPGKNFWNAIYDFTGRLDGANWRVLPLGECRELELRLGEGDQGWQCPAPALSHELLCAAPLKSDDSSGQSMTQIPQTRPELPPLVPGAVAARQTVYNQEVPSVQPTAPANVGYPDGGRKLRKPKWMKVKSLKPDARGVNLLVKVVKVTEVDSKLFEVVLGDDTGCVTLRARPEMVELCKPGAILRVQNALIVMHKGTMRLEVNKWGVLKPEPGEEIQVNEKNDVSAVEYERAKA